MCWWTVEEVVFYFSVVTIFFWGANLCIGTIDQSAENLGQSRGGQTIDALKRISGIFKMHVHCWLMYFDIRLQFISQHHYVDSNRLMIQTKFLSKSLIFFGFSCTKTLCWMIKHNGESCNNNSIRRNQSNANFVDGHSVDLFTFCKTESFIFWLFYAMQFVIQIANEFNVINSLSSNVVHLLVRMMMANLRRFSCLAECLLLSSNTHSKQIWTFINCCCVNFHDLRFVAHSACQIYRINCQLAIHLLCFCLYKVCSALRHGTFLGNRPRFQIRGN